MPTPPATRIGRCPSGSGAQRLPSGISRVERFARRRVGQSPGPFADDFDEDRGPPSRLEEAHGAGEERRLAPRRAADHRELTGKCEELFAGRRR